MYIILRKSSVGEIMFSIRNLKKDMNYQDRVLGVEHVYRVLETLDGMVGGLVYIHRRRECFNHFLYIQQVARYL
jgi:hypothetical protein